jgi:hypothetical protein
MDAQNRIKVLREEYKMYIGLSRDASKVDGPKSRLARFFRQLAIQVKSEMRIQRTASI